MWSDAHIFGEHPFRDFCVENILAVLQCVQLAYLAAATQLYFIILDYILERTLHQTIIEDQRSFQSAKNRNMKCSETSQEIFHAPQFPWEPSSIPACYSLSEVFVCWCDTEVHSAKGLSPNPIRKQKNSISLNSLTGVFICHIALFLQNINVNLQRIL